MIPFRGALWRREFFLTIYGGKVPVNAKGQIPPPYPLTKYAPGTRQHSSLISLIPQSDK